MSKKKPLIKKIKYNFCGITIDIYVTKKKDQFSKKIKSFDPDYNDDELRQFAGGVYVLEDAPLSLCVLLTRGSIFICSHEAVHVATRIIEYLKLDCDMQHDEILAYIVGDVSNKIAKTYLQLK